MYYTLSSKDHNVFSLDHPLPAALLPAASFTNKNSSGKYYLRPPTYPLLAQERGADCGAFTVMAYWGNEYRFTLKQYRDWLYSWTYPPHWAATMDKCCVNRGGTYPGKEEVRRRQQWSTEKAWECWDFYRTVPWAWVPTITGYYLEEYLQHACDLEHLIIKMSRYYHDPGRWDEEEIDAGYGSAFRVGIGSLCGRATPVFLVELLKMLRDSIITPFHLWGIKLGTLQKGIELPGVISCDTSAWNGLFGKEHEEQKDSGKTETEYSWQVSMPDYQQKVAAALALPKQSNLFSQLPSTNPSVEIAEAFYGPCKETNI
jgi:hypothetical protein